MLRLPGHLLRPPAHLLWPQSEFLPAELAAKVGVGREGGELGSVSTDAQLPGAGVIVDTVGTVVLVVTEVILFTFVTSVTVGTVRIVMSVVTNPYNEGNCLILK